MSLTVHLVDGTYELFRYHFAPNNRDPEQGAVVGVLASMLQLIEDGATHVGVATDHVIESFRNDLWPGYKTSAGMPPELLGQFGLLEETLGSAGFAVWPMVAYEADDALASAAAVADADPRVRQAVICTPDKDLGQCVRGQRVVQLDRRKGVVLDEGGVTEKFGVPPASIPDWLALVGDSADGFPGIPGFGAKSAAAVLARYGHLEHIPTAAGQWDVPGLRGAGRLAATLAEQIEMALLFRRIATVERDAEVGTVDDWHWRGPADPEELTRRCADLGAAGLATRAGRLAARAGA